MMVCMAVIFLVAQESGAQEIKIWFSQKQTQTEYLAQQIAALKIYTGYLEKGYKIVQGGLNTISAVKSGHLRLDQAFFEGLEAVNPKVKNYSLVADIVRLNIQAVKLSKKAIREARGSGRFAGDELNYADKVLGRTLDDCGQLTEELTDILSPAKLQLSDDERIKRIDGIYAGMQEHYRFITAFYGDLQELRQQRDRELKETKALEKMYGQ